MNSFRAAHRVVKKLSATRHREVTATMLLDTMHARHGHFEFESGLHGTLLLDVDALLGQPRAVSPLVHRLARHAASAKAEIVCGPMTGGAIIAFSIAERLGLEFVASQRIESARPSGLFRYQYKICAAPDRLCDRRVYVVDDVINAGSAARATLDALHAIDAIPVGLGAVMTLGSAAAQLANSRGISLFSTVVEPMTLWPPEHCPMCLSGQPLERAVNG